MQTALSAPVGLGLKPGGVPGVDGSPQIDTILPEGDEQKRFAAAVRKSTQEHRLVLRHSAPRQARCGDFFGVERHSLPASYPHKIDGGLLGVGADHCAVAAYRRPRCRDLLHDGLPVQAQRLFDEALKHRAAVLVVDRVARDRHPHCLLRSKEVHQWL